MAQPQQQQQKTPFGNSVDAVRAFQSALQSNRDPGLDQAGALEYARRMFADSAPVAKPD
jgi:hypothetical protein